jgi:hypothetical protein
MGIKLNLPTRTAHLPYVKPPILALKIAIKPSKSAPGQENFIVTKYLGWSDPDHDLYNY